MILQSLAEYYEALVRDDADGCIPRYGFSIAKVSFEAHLAPDGRLLALTPLFVTVEQKGKPVQRSRELLAPTPVKRTVGIDANFLCDNAAYLFGFDLKGNRERALECFADAKRLHAHLLARAAGPVGMAVRAFFATFDPAAPCPEIEAQQKALLGGGNIVFSVDGRFAQDDEECRRLWMDHVAVNGSNTLMQCLVTGEIAPVAVLHGNIKGVRGGQAMGTSIVSFNASAFESYGHDGGQGLNAPVSEYAAFAYITALNHLIAQPEHRLFLGDMTIVYWAEKEQAAALDLFGALAGNPAVENADALIGSVLAHIARGEPVEEVDTAQQFCVLGLAPNAGRLSIRFFHQSSFGQTLQKLAGHYQRLKLVHAPFEREYLTPPYLMDATVNPHANDRKSIPPMTGAFMRALLTGGKYPEALHLAAKIRIFAENAPTYARVSILKACLLRNTGLKEENIVALNPDWNDGAYVLGRLFCVLEDLQRESAGVELNASIKDRYFSAACCTPGPIFAQLLRLSRAHLRKLEAGPKIRYEKQIGELMDKLEPGESAFPKRHLLPQQDKFILGYYHQRQAKFQPKEEKKHE